MEALSRDCPIPVFTLHHNQEWMSFYGDYEAIPVEAVDFFHDFNYLVRIGKNGILFDMDWSSKPVWADPDKHWRPFIPRSGFEILGEDPLSFLFEPVVVPTTVHILDGKSGSDDLAVYTLDNQFRIEVEKFAKRLSDTCMEMGGTNSFYGPQSDYTGGPFPLWYRPERVNAVFDDQTSAQIAAASARRGILDMLGFVSWYQLVVPLWDGWRAETDHVFIQRLLLQDRPKVGVLLSPARDYLSMNFLFLMKYKIPTHILWKDAERNSLRFMRYSPRFLKEFVEAKARLPEGRLVSESDLPSYYKWQPSLDRFNKYLVDNQMGRNGEPGTGFDPKAFHAMVDWPHWGRRWVTNREEIRCYAELYHCASALHDSGRFITFFRQEPRLQADGHPRPVPPKDRVELSRFGSAHSRGSDASEGAFYSESPMVVREKYKTRCAPTKEKIYNTFNGRRVNANKMRQEAPPYDRDWNANDPSVYEGKYRSTSYRSSDEAADEVSLGDSELNGVEREPEFPIDLGSSSHEEYSTPIPDEERYAQALMAQSRIILGGEPCVALPAGASWSDLWLSKAVLVFHTQEAQARVRTFANLRTDVENIVDVLNLTIRYGIPLTLYLKEDDIKLFRQPSLTYQELLLVAAMYEPGYVESPLQELASPESTYGAYTARMGAIFARPHAPAFIGEGGMLSWIAQVYAPGLVARFMEGPSLRVTEFRRGQIMAGRKGGKLSDVYTRDCVSADEKELVYGRIPNVKDSSRTLYLWPPQWLLDESSDHFHGMMNGGCQALFDNLCEEIKSGRYRWRTRGGWLSYFRNGNRNNFAPAVIPTSKDFKDTTALILKAHQNLDWNRMPLAEIVVPEIFVLSAPGEWGAL
ncbi:hypothetical protein C8J57DRAFT_1523484 [Mycena rebaudengoi]|nr:hypothetical protein C8J57DRAFT_1523484 [Mycena rebaudengoi]